MNKQLSITIENNRIVKIDYSDVTEVKFDSNRYRFPNGYIMPSFVDSHAHIIGLGQKLNTVPLELAKSKVEALQMVKTINTSLGWITGRGWNEENWEDKIILSSDLDSINSEIPIFLVRVDGHAAWVNTRALELCNIDRDTPDPSGGKIVKNSDGNPTGLLIDNAIELVRDKIPKDSKKDIKKYITDACIECKRNGITEVHDMDVHLEHLEAYKELDDEGNLPIRLVQYIRGFDGQYIEKDIKPYKGNKLEIKGLKFYADGALGSRGALMIEKYSDSDTNGLELISTNELYERAKIGCENEWGIATHAIGDKANRNVLDAYERLRKAGYTNTLRIEHSQLVSPNNIKRFAELGVIASVQPIHCTSDKKMAIHRLGANYRHFYPWATLIDSGAEVIAGSDFPIESHNPFLGIDAFVNRIGVGETETWNEKETLSIKKAMECYTYNPHKITNKSSHYGSIEIGKTADFIVVDNDFTDKASIKNSKVLATICDGKIEIY